MAICTVREGEMNESVSCIYVSWVCGDRRYAPILWGEEVGGEKRIVDAPCFDCGTPLRGVHHPGCCVARCPACLGRAFWCHCSDVPDAELPVNTPEEPAVFRQRFPLRARRQGRCRAHLFPRHYRS
jgi:hypothetical protein